MLHRLLQLFDEVGQRDLGRVAARQPGQVLFQRAEPFLESLDEGPPDRHDLADRLHLRSQRAVGVGELLEGPPRDLHDDVVDRRLERCRGLAGDVVRDLVQRVADRQLRRDLRDREPGRLRGERAGARDAGVHLDHHAPSRGRVHRELNVRAARFDADRAHNANGIVAHPLVFHVGEGHRRSDGDRVAGVNTHRIEVLDRTDDHDVVVAVAHDLELELLPAGDRLFDQHLPDARQPDPLRGHVRELVRRLHHARAPSPEDVGSPDDDGEADLCGGLLRLGDGVGEARSRQVDPGLGHDLLEEAAVFRASDRGRVRADHLDLIRLEHPRCGELHGYVEAGLTTQGRQHRIGPFLLDDLRYVLGRDGLDVGRVCELGVGHDRRRVRVHEHDLVALVSQDLAGLDAGVVELGCLADHDRSGSDNEDLVQVVAPRHQAFT